MDEIIEKVQKKKSSSKKKSTKKNADVKISEEIKKITNTKSKEQIKRPQKIIFMTCFYVALVFAIFILCLIKFSNPKKVEVEKTLLNETSKIETTTEKELDYSDNSKVEEKIVETTVEESTTKEETTTTKAKETTVKETTKPKETTKAKETTKTNATTNLNDVVEDSVVLSNIASINAKRTIETLLPKYKDVLYSYSFFNQFSRDQVATICKGLDDSYKTISERVFGNDVSFDTKGVNGIIYLNYMVAKDFLLAYKDANKANYENMPNAPYLSYIINPKLRYDNSLYTCDLQATVDFAKAVDMGLYYDIPAKFLEKGKDAMPSAVTLKVLKKSKVGFSQSFTLTAMLEILDTECHTKNNPYFDIEDVVGPTPKAVNMLTTSTFKMNEMLKYTTFNYIIFDKKGYVTGIFLIQG